VHRAGHNELNKLLQSQHKSYDWRASLQWEVWMVVH